MIAGSISSIPTAASGSRNGGAGVLGEGSLNARPLLAVPPAYATAQPFR